MNDKIWIMTAKFSDIEYNYYLNDNKIERYNNDLKAKSDPSDWQNDFSYFRQLMEKFDKNWIFTFNPEIFGL